MKLAVPQAVLALKQGFGRLIRLRGDRGVVIIADSRIRTRPYGRKFLASLPECGRLTETWEDCLTGIREFFAPELEHGDGVGDGEEGS